MHTSIFQHVCGNCCRTRYSHAPDPIVVGEPYSITRRFRLLLDRPIQNLTEKFWGYKQTGPAVSWCSFEGVFFTSSPKIGDSNMTSPFH